jgi:hypothetical protein
MANQSSKVKIEHLKEKEYNLKIYAHSQKLDGIVEMMVDIINKFYNEKFKQFLHFCWIQQLIVPHFRIQRLKVIDFRLSHQMHIEIHSTTYTTTSNVNLKRENFEFFHVLLSLDGNLHQYAYQHYFNLTKKLFSWSNF